MENQERYQKIEAYLGGELEGEELNQFTQQLQNDADFASEVELHQDLAEFMPFDEEDALIANLDQIGNKFNTPPTPPSKGNPFKWIFLGLFIIAGLWFVWSQTQSTDVPTVQSEQPTNRLDKKAESAETEFTPIKGEELKEEEKEPTIENNTQQEIKQENKTPQKSKTKETKQEKPKEKKIIYAAADFNTNPLLEEYINNSTRSNFSLEVNSPVMNQEIKLQNGQFEFNLSGLIKTDEKELESNLRCLVFDNKEANYENFEFVADQALEVVKTDESFTFNFTKNIEGKYGLYYFLIEDEDSGMLYYVGKFEVR